MAGVTAQGGTFTFTSHSDTATSFVGRITRLSVDTPTAEVVDMTSHDAPLGAVVLVPTGSWSGGAISVDYIRVAGSADPKDLVRTVGPLSFSSSGLSVSTKAILESATIEASTGDLVRGTLKFRLTDYTATITSW